MGIIADMFKKAIEDELSQSITIATPEQDITVVSQQPIEDIKQPEPSKEVISVQREEVPSGLEKMVQDAVQKAVDWTNTHTAVEEPPQMSAEESIARLCGFVKEGE